MIGSRSPAVRGSRSPTANSPCPAVRRDDEGCTVESSDDGTSDEERKKREMALFVEGLTKLNEAMQVTNNLIDECILEK